MLRSMCIHQGRESFMEGQVCGEDAARLKREIG